MLMTIFPSPTHHPSDEHLLDYASGAAAEPMALVVASHLSFCPRCRGELQQLDRLGGALLDEIPPDAMSDGSFDRLMALIERSESTVNTPLPSMQANINADMPEALRRHLDRPLVELPWSRRGPLFELELLPNMANHKTRLLWIRAGAAAPRHTHEGNELTIVLKGSFRDSHGHYACGDVAEADGDIDHRPIANDDEDCLCLTVTDAPLKLTSPIGRLINPFVRV